MYKVMTTQHRRDYDSQTRQQLQQHDISESNRYVQLEKIGNGAYGVVYKAKDVRNNHRFVAMKIIRVENTDQGIPLSTVREIALLRQLDAKQHDNVVRLLDICIGRETPVETELMLVFEHIDQDLDIYLKNSPSDGIHPEKIKDIMKQMLLGVDFLHSMRVIHRDLKPQNILITSDGRIKLADFGLARIYSINMTLTAVVVTLWYRSPEVLLQDSYASPVDLWSVGCIFAELFNKRPLFRGNGDVNQLRLIFDFIGRPSQSDWPSDVAISLESFDPQPPKTFDIAVPRMSPVAADLFLKLLTFKQDDRLSAEKALKHPYFTSAPQFTTNSSKERSTEGHKPFFLSDEVTNAIQSSLACSLGSTSKPSSSHHRLPYTDAIGRSEQANYISVNLKTSVGYDCSDGAIKPRSGITPLLEQVTTSDSPTSDPSSSKTQSYITPPVPKLPGSEDEKDQAFLTPPSDLASSSSGCLSSSSSRASSLSSSESSGNTEEVSEDLLAHQSHYRHPAADEVEGFESSKDETRSGNVKMRGHTNQDRSSEDSRMSWRIEAPQENFESSQFKTPSTRIQKDTESSLITFAHSSQSSFSSNEGSTSSSSHISRPDL